MNLRGNNAREKVRQDKNKKKGILSSRGGQLVSPELDKYPLVAIWGNWALIGGLF